MLATPDLSLVYILVLFGIAYFILKNLFFRPILSVLDARTKEITEAEEGHLRALENAKRAIAAAEERLASVRREAIAGRQKLRGEGQAVRAKKLEAARNEAEKIVAAERAKLDEQLPALKTSLKNQAELLAVEVTSRILGRTLA